MSSVKNILSCWCVASSFFRHDKLGKDASEKDKHKRRVMKKEMNVKRGTGRTHLFFKAPG